MYTSRRLHVFFSFNNVRRTLNITSRHYLTKRICYSFKPQSVKCLRPEPTEFTLSFKCDECDVQVQTKPTAGTLDVQVSASSVLQSLQRCCPLFPSETFALWQFLICVQIVKYLIIPNLASQTLLACHTRNVCSTPKKGTSWSFSSHQIQFFRFVLSHTRSPHSMCCCMSLKCLCEEKKQNPGILVWFS